MLGLPSRTIFYLIERSIKEYRRFAQKNINELSHDITVDHALILFFIADNPNLSQSEIGNLIFKDNASVTRMIDLMIKNGFLQRDIHKEDRRKFRITLTPKGLQTKKGLKSIVQFNRAHALEGVSEAEIDQLATILEKIISNCTKT
ncbi:MarR family winged helix-turn-helix transcriptional regulator [Flagellimonas nanhaiensis]|uniref:MarR family transcriptional regulator n=1 Tax=Flagellimonas nanhaiensis TaxID=2292706 RepID=A0A371JLB0_9FLAO|nr:MarR family transcriptional regulator [Allomuricauda nanhaiensis]RDY57745.1 MarR family transcriptional regulator [Allomuricauda nanhaiensis]